MQLSTRSDLLTLIDQSKSTHGWSDAELCRRAGLSANVFYNLRRYPRRSIMLTTAVAMIEACGYRLVVTPDAS